MRREKACMAPAPRMDDLEAASLGLEAGVAPLIAAEARADSSAAVRQVAGLAGLGVELPALGDHRFVAGKRIRAGLAERLEGRRDLVGWDLDRLVADHGAQLDRARRGRCRPAQRCLSRRGRRRGVLALISSRRFGRTCPADDHDHATHSADQTGCATGRERWETAVGTVRKAGGPPGWRRSRRGRGRARRIRDRPADLCPRSPAGPERSRAARRAGLLLSVCWLGFLPCPEPGLRGWWWR